MKNVIKYIFRFFKLVLIKEKNYFNAEENLYKSLKFNNIGAVIDVGAHQGKFIKNIFKFFKFIKVISFEPIKKEFKNLSETSNKYKNWKIYNYALGANNEKKEINISNYTEASSLLNIENKLLQFRPELKTQAKETIECKKLDNFIDEFSNLKKPILLKIDTQGYEMEVLKGADKTLEIINFIFIEVSIVQNYVGQPTLKEILIYLENKNFKVVSLDRVFGDRLTGETYQVNILFSRKLN